MQSLQNNIEIISSQNVLERIKINKALIQILNATIGNDYPWEKLLRQIAEPKTFRPTRWLNEDKFDRSRIFNPKTGQWENRNIAHERGLPKDTIYTKKQALTLLPSDGKMYFYKPFNSPDTVGIIYDLELCHLKNEKYIFTKDMCTNSKFWLKMKDGDENEHKVSRSISLQQLKQQIENERARGIIPQYNEVMAGISKQAVLAIFATKNILYDRLNALAKKYLIKKYLNKDIPLYIITPEDGIIEYTNEQQELDICECSKLKDEQPEKTLLNIYKPLILDNKQINIDLNENRFLPNYHEKPNKNLVWYINQLPNEIKDSIFSYLSLKEITQLIRIKTNDNEFRTFQDYCANKFDAKVRDDLSQLLPVIGLNLNKHNLLEKDYYSTILKYLEDYIRKNAGNVNNHVDFLERAIIHLHYISANNAQQLLIGALLNNSFSINILKLLITNIGLPEVKIEKMEVGTYTYSRNKKLYLSDSNGTRADDCYYDSSSRREYYSDSHGHYYYNVQWYSEPVYIYNGTILLAGLLKNDYELSKIIITEYQNNLDGILSGLLELQAASNRWEDKLNYSSKQICAAISTVAIILSEINYKPGAMNSEFRTRLNFLIESAKLKRILKLKDLILFAERNQNQLEKFDKFLTKLKDFTNDAISDPNTLNGIFDQAIRILSKVDINICSDVLDKIILNGGKNCIDLIEILLNHGAELRLKIFNTAKDGTFIREDILNISRSLNRIRSQCHYKNQITIIESFREKVNIVISELEEKEKFLSKMVSQIQSHYRSNKAFKVYYLRGRKCPFLGNQTVPDGVAKIMEIYNKNSLNIEEKFQQAQSIIYDKTHQNYNCSFWQTKRDTRLKTFYHELDAGFSDIGNKYSYKP